MNLRMISVIPSEVSSNEPIAKADIPEWLMSMAPTEITEKEKNEFEQPPVALSTSENGIPDWLKPMAPADGTTDLTLESQSSVSSASESGVNSIAPVEAADKLSAESEGSTESQPARGEDISDSHKLPAAVETGGEPPEGSQEPIESQPATGKDIPDWFKAVTPAETPEAAIPKPQELTEPQPTSSEDLPEWLKSMAPAEAIDETLKERQEPVESQPPGGEDIPDWLKSKAPAESVGETLKEPQKPIEPEPAVNEDIPDWLKSMAPAGTADKLNVEFEPTLSEVTMRESEAEPTSAEKKSTGAEPLPDWLKGMDTTAPPATPSAKSEEQAKISGQPLPEQPVHEKPIVQTPAKSQISEPETLGESFQPSGEVKPLNIGDDALGWLEGLAAKQGAKPEEMLTNPRDRSMEMPDWLRQPGEKSIDTSAVPKEEQVISPAETLPLEPLDQSTSPSRVIPGQPIEEALARQEEVQPSELPVEEGTKPEVQSTGGEEDTMSWLERLSEDQELTRLEPLLSPKENLETKPEEDQQISETQPTARLPGESAPVSPEPAAGEDITITSWLSKQNVEEALGKISTEQPGEEKPAAPVEELPDWLKGLESSTTPAVTPKPVEDLPDWLRTPIAPAEPEKTSGPEVPAWVDENVPGSGQAVPTMPEEWIPAEVKLDTGLEPVTSTESIPAGENLPAAVLEPIKETIPASESKPAAEPEPISEHVSISVHSLLHPPTLKQTGMLSAVPEQDKDAELLSNAQTILDQDFLDELMKQYTKLVKKGRLLDEVIHDLREAIYRYPVDVIIWQTLGDAYMRANRLQDALDAYTKAEELLR